MAANLKTLSPAELAKLEHAFATNPTSEAYKPLAEAYLAMGRFMEAMVVCKKGVKAHPNAADPRVLLAKVYADQGKDKKALEELVGALQVAPNDKVILRAAAALQLKTGDPESGKTHLLKAYQIDPNDQETLAAMQQAKLEPLRAPAPAPSAPPVLNPTRAPSAPAAVRSGDGVSMRAAAAVAVQQAVLERPAARPAQRPAPKIFPPPPQWEPEPELVAAATKRVGTRKLFLVLVLAIPVFVVGYTVFGRWRAYHNREIKKYLDQAAEQLRHDSYSSYKKASEAADKALELDPTSTAAHGYLAYAYAVRWGEHGGGDEAHRMAEEHLQAAVKGGDISSYVFAASALLKSYSGKSQSAASELESQIKRFEAEGHGSQLLYLTLGLIDTSLGDFERARESLEKAQSLAPDDPRVYAALGTLYRRRGQDLDAAKNFDSALRYERDHPYSLLGKALLILQVDRPDYGVATRTLRKLIDADPPPSPRQLATAYLARALLISRVSKDLPDYKPEYQKQLSELTGVPLDRAKAQAEMTKAEEAGFTLDRSNPELRVIKGTRLLFEGNVDGAVAEIRQAVRTDPTRALYYVELAKALLQKPGGTKEAQDVLSTAIRTLGESPRLMVMLGHVYRQQGKVDEALAQYTRAVSDAKFRNPEARLAIGSIYREKHELNKALESLEKAMREFVGQSSRLAVTYAELGRTLEEKGDRAKADEAYQKALNSDADYAPAYFFYARFLSAEPKQGAKARTTAQEYLKLEPKGEFAAEAQRLAL